MSEDEFVHIERIANGLGYRTFSEFARAAVLAPAGRPASGLEARVDRLEERVSSLGAQVEELLGILENVRRGEA